MLVFHVSANPGYAQLCTRHPFHVDIFTICVTSGSINCIWVDSHFWWNVEGMAVVTTALLTPVVYQQQLTVAKPETSVQDHTFCHHFKESSAQVSSRFGATKIWSVPDPNQVVFVPKPYQPKFKNAFKHLEVTIFSMCLWRQKNGHFGDQARYFKPEHDLFPNPFCA